MNLEVDLGAAFLGTLLGSLVGAFAGAFLGYQFTRQENARVRELEQGEQLINTLHKMVLDWLTEAIGARDVDEIDVRMRRAPVIVDTMKELDGISPQEVAALDKLRAAAPALMLELAQTPIEQRAEAFDRALETVTGHVAVLRRALRDRTRSRAWPFWPSGRSRQE
jgi:hypothetical protein